MDTGKNELILASKKFKEYGATNLESIVGFLADQAKYKGELNPKELSEKITNITEDTYKESDFKDKSYIVRERSTPFDLIFVTMMYWDKIDKVDLKKLNSHIAKINDLFLKELESQIQAREDKDNIRNGLDLVFFGPINSPMTLFGQFDPGRNIISSLFSDDYIVNFHKNKFKFNIITEEVIKDIANRLISISELIDSIKDKDVIKNNKKLDYNYYLEKYQSDNLSKNIIRLVESYPCITKDEITKIILNRMDNRTIAKFLKTNTITHGHSLKVWDKYQYAQDSQALKLRERLLKIKSNSYKDIEDLPDNIDEKKVSECINKLIKDEVLIYTNPSDEYHPPYVNLDHQSREYLALKTDKILDSLYEVSMEVSRLENENFFNQFLR